MIFSRVSFVCLLLRLTIPGVVTVCTSQGVETSVSKETPNGGHNRNAEIQADGDVMMDRLNGSSEDICGIFQASYEIQLNDARAYSKNLEQQLEIYKSDVSRLHHDIQDSRKDRAEAELKLQEKKDMLTESESSLKEAKARLQEQNDRLLKFEEEKSKMDGVKNEAIMHKASSRQCYLELEEISSKLEAEEKRKVNSDKESQLLEDKFRQCQTNLDSTRTSLNVHSREMENEVKAQLDESMKECRSNLVESESNYNNEVQKMQTLEKAMERLTRDKDKVIKRLERKNEQGSKELETK